jgi:hypothetical protein
MSTDELMRMVKTCGLNRMAVYATFLSVYIKAAQNDPEVLKALQGFRQIVHGGVALNREDEEWAYANKLPITVFNCPSMHLNQPSNSSIDDVCDLRNWYADLHSAKLETQTNSATLMTTKIGSSPSDRLLRLIPGGSARLIPYAMAENSNDNTSASSSPQLWEVVLPSGAPDCPHSSLCSKDGLYHTGDLFEEVQPGLYTFRGRKDDWLKTVMGFCDTK